MWDSIPQPSDPCHMATVGIHFVVPSTSSLSCSVGPKVVAMVMTVASIELWPTPTHPAQVHPEEAFQNRLVKNVRNDKSVKVYLFNYLAINFASQTAKATVK